MNLTPAELGLETLYTVAEVAHRLRVDLTTVRRWIRTGALEAIELPGSGRRVHFRVKQSTLDAVLGGAR